MPRVRPWLLLFVLILLGAGAAPTLLAANPVRIAPDPDFAPVDFFDARGRHQGVSAELLALLAPRAELRFETRRFTSREAARAALLDGQIELLSGVLVDSADPRLIYSRPYLRLPAALIGRLSAGAAGTLDELSGRQVTVVAGQGWGALLAARVPDAIVMEAPDTRTALGKVRAGEAEAHIGDLPSVELALRELGLQAELGVLGNPDLHVDVAFAALPAQAELLQRLDQALSRVTAEEDARLRARLFEARPAAEASTETLAAIPETLAPEIQRLRDALPASGDDRQARLTTLDQAAAANTEADQLLGQREQLVAEIAAARALLDSPEAPGVAVELLRWRSSLPPRASLDDLEQLRALELAAREDLLASLQRAVGQIDGLRLRPAALRRELSALNLAAQALPVALEIPDPIARVLAQAEARRDAARGALLRRELDETETLLRAAERKQRERQQALLLREERITVLEGRIAEQSDQELLELLAQLREELRRQESAEAPLRDAAAENLALGERMLGQSRRLAQLREQDLRLERKTAEVARALANARARVEIGGITPAVGRLLMAERRKLPATAAIGDQLRAVQSELVEVRLAQLAVGDEREALSSINTSVRNKLGGDQDQAQITDPTLRATLTDLHLRRAELLPRLEQQQQRLASGLESAERHLRQLGEDGRALSGLIEQHLLWVPSHRPWSRPWFGPLYNEVADLLKWSRWQGTMRRLSVALSEAPIWWALLGLPLLLWSLWPRIDRALARLSVLPPTHYGSTLSALLLTLLRAAPMALLLFLLGQLLQIAGEGGRFTHNLGRALVDLVPHVYLATLLIASCRPGGLAEAHLRWTPARREALLALRPWLYFLLLPMLFLVALGQARDLDYPAGLLLQGSLSLASLSLAGLAVWLLAPGRLLAGAERGADPHPKWRMGLRIGSGLVGVALAALPFAGYILTVGILLGTLLDTLWMLFAVLLGHGLVWRWLVLSERRLALSEAPTPAPVGTDESGNPLAAEETPDLQLVCTQSHGLLKATTALLLGLGLIWSLAPVAPAFALLDTLTLWQTVTQVDGTNVISPVTLGDVLLAIAVLVFGVIAARNLPGLLELLVLQRFPVDASLRYAIVTVSRYLITFLLLVLVFGLLGVRWGHLQWMAAAFSVGLGFGLQEIFGNFVAGLILLFERPFRVGDVVTIGNFTGTVRKIRTRATTIVDFDNKDIVIPNKSLITDRFVNWTLSDSSTRIIVKVGVEYGADADEVRALLLKIAQTHPQVLKDPAPAAFLLEFGASALHFELRCFVGTIADRLRVTHALHAQIQSALRDRGLSIPFPQMDVHLQPRPTSESAA